MKKLNKETQTEISKCYNRLYKLRGERDMLSLDLKEVNSEIESECAYIARLKIHGVEKFWEF